MLRRVLAPVVLAAIIAIPMAAKANVFQMPSGDMSLSFVTVGDPGNVADSTGYGAVSSTFYMGKYDVTLGQYCQFLNAVAATDTYGCYNIDMAGVATYPFGISRTGNPGGYVYLVSGSNSQAADMPVFCETWLDAARFCNWLQNGQPTGSEGTTTTETGAYTLNGDVSFGTESRNAGATFFIPSENEWYKACYYKSGGTNGGYWMYPTQSNVAPGNSLALAMSQSNEANYYNGSSYTDPTDNLTPVGAFSASPGPYGTYDMGGDLYQWNEALDDNEHRGVRGGNWLFDSYFLTSSSQESYSPTIEINDIGFRVASSEAVPEPAGTSLVVAGAVGLAVVRMLRSYALSFITFPLSLPTLGIRLRTPLAPRD